MTPLPAPRPGTSGGGPPGAAATASEPRITVLLPTRDEEHDLSRALEALAGQDLPLGDVEVIVVDSGSRDATRAVAEEHLRDRGFRRAAVLANPGGSTPSNLNTGLAAARGRIVCRVDARSIIPPHHLRVCAALLEERPDVAVVGGAQVTAPRDAGPWSTGIARALNNRYGMGLSRYRRGASSGPADTVYLGAFRRRDLLDAGGWDERFPTNQDFELNRRLARTGLVWFTSELEVGYLPRETLAALFSQYHRFGRWKVRYWRHTGDAPRPRQVALLVVPPVAAGAAAWVIARRPRRAPLLLGAAGLAGLVVEIVGGDHPPGPPSAHLAAMAGMAAVAGGWTSGAWAEAVEALCRIRPDEGPGPSAPATPAVASVGGSRRA